MCKETVLEKRDCDWPWRGNKSGEQFSALSGEVGDDRAETGTVYNGKFGEGCDVWVQVNLRRCRSGHERSSHERKEAGASATVFSQSSSRSPRPDEHGRPNSGLR